MSVVTAGEWLDGEDVLPGFRRPAPEVKSHRYPVTRFAFWQLLGSPRAELRQLQLEPPASVNVPNPGAGMNSQR